MFKLSHNAFILSVRIVVEKRGRPEDGDPPTGFNGTAPSQKVRRAKPPEFEKYP